MEKGQQLALVIGLVAIGFVIMYFVTRKEPVDAEGDTRCEGSDLYIFRGGQWELEEANSPACQLPDVPEPDYPPENPPGFEVDKVSVNPPVVIIGNPVAIKVNWFCPNPLLIERDFGITCMVDGKILQKAWTVRAGNGSVTMPYMPEAIGTYTATVLDKSCIFEVKEEVLGAYYSPYGGYEISASIDALVNAIAAGSGGWKHSGSLCSAYNQSAYLLTCPYCSKSFQTSCYTVRLPEGDKQRVAYAMIEHIQNSHPTHPLTTPRCHIEVSVPEPPDKEHEYAVRIDKETSYSRLTSRAVWYSVGWETIYHIIAPPTTEYQAMRAFVTNTGKHHIEVRGPVKRTILGWREDPYDTPGIFDKDIQLTNLGDKAAFDVQSGIAEVVEWRW